MRIDTATTASPTGLPVRNRSPRSKSTIAATPIANTQQIDVADLACKPDRPVEEVVAATGYAEQAR